jgi:4-amino-4-deoxy-L-arabinose transferase-like glycosyltransferase
MTADRGRSAGSPESRGASALDLRLWPRRGPVLLLVFALALAFFVNLGNAPLFDRDEGAFTEATREMLESGNYISTTLNGEPRYDKPILTYWVQAVGVGLLGWNEWGMRLHSAFAAVLWVLVVWGFARREWDEATGWAAAMITATTLWVMIIGRAATADALLNLFLTLTLVDLYRFWKEKRRPPLYRVFLWSALGFLTKGPIAVAVPLAAAFLLALVRGQLPRYLRAIFNPVGWLIFFGVAAPWYLAVYLQDGQAFIDGFFLRHNLNRFADTMHGHGGVLWYFVPVILLVLLPHSSLFLRTLRRIRSAGRSDLELFLWLWFAFVFLFFSISSTQLPHYVLYGATPLFLLMARYREDLRNSFLTLLPALFLALLLFFLPEIWRLAEPFVDDAFTLAIMSVAPEALGPAYRAWTGLGLAAILVLLFIKGWTPWSRLAGAGIAVAGVVALALFPTYGQIQQGPTKEAALLAREKGWDVVMWRLDMPSFAVYFQDITPLREPEPGEVVFTRVTRLGALEIPTEVLFQKGGIVLARALEGPAPEGTAAEPGEAARVTEPPEAARAPDPAAAADDPSH